MCSLLGISFILILGSVCGSELCKRNEWYDDLQGICRECTACTGKLLEIAPCTSFMNTMCIDLKELNKSLMENMKAGQRKEEDSIIKKASSVENSRGPDQPKGIFIMSSIEHPKFPNKDGKTNLVISVSKAGVSKNDLELVLDPWDLLFSTVICILVLFAFLLTVITLIKFYGFLVRQCRLNKASHSKLVHRDKLNTTDYMKNLGCLDRRLAIDEILEKRKRAIFEPKLMKENIYTDEVFVDISGFPRDLNIGHNEDLDKKSLLEMEVKSQP